VCIAENLHFSLSYLLKACAARALTDLPTSGQLQRNAVSDVMSFNPRLSGYFPWYFFYWQR